MFHPEHCRVKIVQTELDLHELQKKMRQSKYLFFDTETTGLKVRHVGKDYVVGYTVAFDDEVDERVFYVPLAHEFEGVYSPEHITRELMEKRKLKRRDFPEFSATNQDIFIHNYHGFFDREPDRFHHWVNVDMDLFLKYCKEEMENPEHIFVAHNISFDLHVLQNMGIDVNKMTRLFNYEDTMIMVHTFNEEEDKKLEKFLEHNYGIVKCDFDDVVATVTSADKKSVGYPAAKKATFNLVQIPVGAQYSAEDVWYMKNMFADIVEALDNDETMHLYRKLRIPFLKSLWDIERRGVCIDLELRQEMEIRAKEELDKMQYAIYEIAGTAFNLNSGQQVAEILYGHVKTTKNSEGQYKQSCNEELVNLSFRFPITHWTAGGKTKDKKLRAPQVNEDSLSEIVKKEFKGVKNARKREGQKLVKILMKYNRLKKLYESFIVGILDNVYENGRVHPSFNQCGTDSWRLSCSDPNLQQLPRPLELPKKIPTFDQWEGSREEFNDYCRKLQKEWDEYNYWKQFEIRDLLIPDMPDEHGEYVIISSDYSNIEKRITAHLTEDEKLVELLVNGYDGHGFIATLIFDECRDVHPNEVKKRYKHLRQIAKGIGFAMDYGGSEFTVSKNLGISKELARQYIDKYFEGFCGLAQWMEEQKRFGRRNGYVLTLLGHKRHLSGIRSEDMGIRSYYERICLNAPVQGTAADVITLAQLKIDADPRLRLLNCTCRIQVHDELVFVAPKKYVHICMDIIQDLMSNALPEPLIVPLFAEADYGTRYAQAH